MSKPLDIIIRYVEEGNPEALNKLLKLQKEQLEVTKDQVAENTKQVKSEKEKAKATESSSQIIKKQITETKNAIAALKLEGKEGTTQYQLLREELLKLTSNNQFDSTIRIYTERLKSMSAQGKQGTAEFKKLKNELDSLKNTTKNTTGSFNDLIAKFGGVAAAAAALRGGIALIGSSSANAGIIQASRNIGIQTSLIKDLNKAYQGQLTTLQRHQVASASALRGVSGERLIRTATLANQLSDAGFGDAIGITDQITSALETGRIRGLAPYIVDFQNLNEEVKEGIINQEQLLGILEKNAARLGDINADEAADQLGRINVQFQEMKQFSGEQLAKAFTPVLKFIGDIAQGFNDLPEGVKNIFLGTVAVGGTGVAIAAGGGALGQTLTFLKNGWAELGVVALGTNAILKKSNPILDDINSKILQQKQFIAELTEAYNLNLGPKKKDLDFENQKLESLEKTKEALINNKNALVDVAEENTFLSGKIRNVVIPVWGQWAIGIVAVTNGLLQVHNWLSALSDGKWNINVIWPNMPEWLRGLTSGNQSYGMGPTRADANKTNTPSRETLVARAQALKLDIPKKWGANIFDPFQYNYTYSDEELLRAINREEARLGIPLTRSQPSTQLGGEWKNLYVKNEASKNQNLPNLNSGSSSITDYLLQPISTSMSNYDSLYDPTLQLLYGDRFYRDARTGKISSKANRKKIFNDPLKDYMRKNRENFKPSFSARERMKNMFGFDTSRPDLMRDALLGRWNEIIQPNINARNQSIFDFNTSLLGLHGQDRINKLLEADAGLLGSDEARHKHNVARKMQARNAAMQAVGDIAGAAATGGASAAAVAAIQTGLNLVVAANPGLAIPLGIVSAFVPGLFAPHERKTIPGPTDVRLINPEEVYGPINASIQQFMRLTARGVGAGGRQFIDERLALQGAGLRGI